jgi:hypothetical protein
MSSIMFWLLSILTEETDVPFIGRQPKGRLLPFKRLRKRGFSRARKSHHQMERRHTYSSWSWYCDHCTHESGEDQLIIATSGYAWRHLFIITQRPAAGENRRHPAWEDR